MRVLNVSFATVFLYLSNTTLGGETVFPLGDDMPTEPEQGSDERVNELKSKLFTPSSWESRLTDKCRSKVRVRPHAGDAILFYSQTPEGQMDDSSLHGACPVLEGEKYGANLWIWNDKRWDQHRADQKAAEEEKKKKREEVEASAPGAARKVSFVNDQDTDVSVYWVDAESHKEHFVTSLKPHAVVHQNTYIGHTFVSRTQGGAIVSQHTITPELVLYSILHDGL